MIPYLHCVVSDWPEGQNWCGCYQGPGRSTRNCRKCLQLTSTFSLNSGKQRFERLFYSQFQYNVARADDGRVTRQLRTACQTQSARDMKPGKERTATLIALSVHSEPSPYGPPTELYTGAAGMHGCAPSDVMHVIGSNGVVSKLRYIAGELGNLAKMDDRIGQIPMARDIQAVRGMRYCCTFSNL